MKPISRLASFFAVATLLISLQTFAGVPATLNYQGTLTDNTGQPVNGSKSITFRLYNAPTGGTAFWTETQTINLVNGRLSVVLGGNAGNPIDPKKFTGETYIGIQVAPDAEMPRQKFTSVAYAFQAGEGGVPPGGIIMWSGAANAIPAGWALCDGTNGTPNLRDKFILGGGGSLPATGGTTSHNHSLPGHAHTISADGNHSHHIDVQFYNCIGDCDDGADDGSKSVGSESHGHHLIADTQAAGNHSHSGQTGSGGGGTSGGADHLPPYYALAFIMKL